MKEALLVYFADIKTNLTCIFILAGLALFLSVVNKKELHVIFYLMFLLAIIVNVLPSKEAINLLPL